MKLGNLLEELLDMPGSNQQEPSRKANIEILEKKIQDAFNKTLTIDPEAKKLLSSVKTKIQGGQTIVTTTSKEGKTSTSTFNTSHITKYLNNPKFMAELLLKKGYYES